MKDWNSPQTPQCLWTPYRSGVKFDVTREKQAGGKKNPGNVPWTAGPKLKCANVLRVCWVKHSDVFFFIGK